MRVFLRAIKYFRDDLPLIGLELIFIVLQTALGLLTPFPLAVLIDSVLSGKHMNQWVHRIFFNLVPTNNLLYQILALAAAALILRLLQEVLTMFQTLINIQIGYNGLMRVRCELFAKLQALSLSYHRSQPQGDAIYRLSYDTFGFQGVLNVLSGLLVNIVTLVIMTWIMLSMNWQMTLVALSVSPLLVWTFKHYGKILEVKATEAHAVDSELTTTIQRSVAHIGLVQAFGREAEEYARFTNTVRNSMKTWLNLHWHEVLYWLYIGMSLGLGSTLIFGYGGYLIYKGSLTIGQLTIFLAYLTKLYDPLNRLSGTGAGVAAGVAGVKRVLEVLDRDPVIKDSPNAMPLPREARMLELADVSFDYRDGEPVLRGISAKIEPGQMVAFVGSSGVGKTTLLNLLPRFYDPTRGALLLGGHDLRKVRLADLRKHIALVVQENVILPTSVAENIAYGRPEATDEQIRRAAEMAGASSFIDKLPDKYDAQISESGQNLSGGQRQRIAIARALLTEAPILILDEPTSALDPQHEHMITDVLRGLKGQRTVIIVSHRLSTVADCDRIFVMDEGRIVEDGTHDELVARRGTYFQMAKHQLKLADDEPAADLAAPSAV